MNKEIIKKIVDEYYEINIATDTRKREYVEARFLYFKILKELTNMSLEAIGKQVGRDHSSVLYGIEQFNTWTKTYSRLKTDYKAIMNKIINYEAIKQEHQQGNIVILDKDEFKKIEITLKENQSMIKTLIEEYKSINNKYQTLQSKAKKYGIHF